MKLDNPNKMWTPTEEFVENSGLHKYMQWLNNNYNLDFSEYKELWEWSTDNIETFWESLTEYFDVKFHDSYDSVLSGNKMPHYKWFEGSTLNYAEHIFRNMKDDSPALIAMQENSELKEMSWEELEDKVARMASYLRSCGVEKGDAVVAFTANIPESTIAFLATLSIGAIWSSCSPDFGKSSVLERFGQIEPKVLIAVNGYYYNGKTYDKRDVVKSIQDELPNLEATVSIPYLKEQEYRAQENVTMWEDVMKTEHDGLKFEVVPFSHPMWVLYSSGTTGDPKAITHSHGGMLLEHLKYMTFHNDVKVGERFFWYSTTGWMMWNFVHASLLVGATAVLYDGSAAHPDLETMWSFIEEADIQHFGTSAPFIVACMKRDINPQKYDLSGLRSIGSTGSPLPPEAFEYIKNEIKDDIWLCSMSGGTDVCTAFVGGCPTRPVYVGEIQCRALGCDLHALDEQGNKLMDAVGEMVIMKPMPCMPIYLWNDPEYERYKESYLSMYDGLWRHGDWITITERDSLVILGRSDATLNRKGVRIGTAEIYRVINEIDSIEDALIVNLEMDGGRHFMPLFVKMREGEELTDELKSDINSQLKKTYSPRHVPDSIENVPDIPYTISGKKMEAPVKKILMQMPLDKAINKDAMKNPESVDFYVEYAKSI